MNFRYLVYLLLFNTLCLSIKAQYVQPPKLVVGIVIDQMRYDYIYRFWDKYAENGFKKLVNNGFSCENTHYNYVPTYTGPGHASIYTGTTPSEHGICGNEWYDRKEGKMTYCVFDQKFTTIGGNGKGNISPENLKVATIGDQLKQATNFRSKVISISLKDRAAVLPGGHLADGAFWLDGKSGDFVSSSYYMKTLPAWIGSFNKANWTEQYLEQKWETLLPIDQYVESISDENPYEVPFKKESNVTFPYDLAQLQADPAIGKGIIKTTPWGNTIVFQLATEALTAEKLGKNQVTDMLLVSCSATDYVGHRFGPRSIELEDTYLRLDKDLAAFISKIEATVGEENALIFLTADHGVVDVPAYLKDHHLSGGHFDSDLIQDSLNALLSNVFHTDDLVKSVINYQVYFDRKKIKANKVNFKEVMQKSTAYISEQPFVKTVYEGIELRNKQETTDRAFTFVKNGFFPERSGDLVFLTQPGWINAKKEQGTTHGSAYQYDTHVPLLWYGWKIKPGNSVKRVQITDIVPTLSYIMKTALPDATSGQPIELNLD